MRVLIALLAFVSTAVLAQENPTRSDDELETIPVEDRSGTDSAPPASDDDEMDEHVFYSGMSIEKVTTDYDNLGDPVNLGVVLGFRIPPVPWAGLEIDLAQTIIPGDYRDPDPGAPACTDPPLNTVPPGCVPGGQPPENGAADPDDSDFAMQAIGVSAAFKSTGRWYVMGRYGYRYLITSNETINEKRSGNGFAVGAGYRWGTGTSGIEVNYKELGEHVEAMGLTFFARLGRN